VGGCRIGSGGTGGSASIGTCRPDARGLPLKIFFVLLRNVCCATNFINVSRHLVKNGLLGMRSGFFFIRDLPISNLELSHNSSALHSCCSCIKGGKLPHACSIVIGKLDCVGHVWVVGCGLREASLPMT
jgi:hypothetical protein